MEKVPNSQVTGGQGFGEGSVSSGLERSQEGEMDWGLLGDTVTETGEGGGHCGNLATAESKMEILEPTDPLPLEGTQSQGSLWGVRC